MKNFLSKEGYPPDALAEAHQNLLSKAKVLARNLAQRNLPQPGDSLQSHVAPITAGYRNLISQHVTVKPAGDELKDLRKEAQEAKRARLDERLHRSKDELLRTEMELQEMEGTWKDIRYLWVAHVAIVLYASCEAAFTAGSFEVIDLSSNLSQILMLLGLTVLFVMLPHFVVRTFRRTRRSPQRLLIWAGIGALVLAAFCVLAFLRSLYLATVGGAAVSIAWFFWVPLQLFMLLVSAFLASLVPPSEQLARSARAKKLIGTRKRLQDEIEGIRDELASLPEAAYRAESMQAEAQGRATETESRIVSMYHETLGEFIALNLLLRDDRARPACFDEPFPELKTN